MLHVRGGVQYRSQKVLERFAFDPASYYDHIVVGDDSARVTPSALGRERYLSILFVVLEPPHVAIQVVLVTANPRHLDPLTGQHCFTLPRTVMQVEVSESCQVSSVHPDSTTPM